MDYDILKQLFGALETEGVQYAVFGAIALNIHGLGRYTADLDLFIPPDSENVERLKRALRSVIDDPEIDEIEAVDLLGEYPAVEYNLPDGSFHIDILTRLGNAFAWSDLEVERRPFEELTVSVVSADALPNEERYGPPQGQG